LSVLASLLGITPQAVSQWRHVPAARVLAVERATKGAVSRFQLRPDLYPPDSA
jgi:DNA-binding transcriptional regulator YdaS (Cro superfamily)